MPFCREFQVSGKRGNHALSLRSISSNSSGDKRGTFPVTEESRLGATVYIWLQMAQLVRLSTWDESL